MILSNPLRGILLFVSLLHKGTLCRGIVCPDVPHFNVNNYFLLLKFLHLVTRKINM